ncbi:MAG: hypothetical protein Q4B54_10340, partial [Coriobacteriales bacterium]|nr:hypothetical protein [Coriobacteriales bacterium]
ALEFARSYEKGVGWPSDPTKAKPIKVASQLVGSWKSSGFVTSLIYMEGDLESVDVSPLSITLKEDGTGKVTHPALGEGEDVKWEIDANGAKVTSSKGSFTLLDGGDYLIADMAGVYGKESYYVLVKA